jgi:integrase
MGVYERDPKTGRRCKKGQRGVWYYYFTVNGRRYRSSIPEATNKKQAEIAESAARVAVFNGTYGRKEGGKGRFPDFVMGEYLEWAKANKKSWRFDHTYAPVIAEYFKGKRFCDITSKAVERYRDHRLAQPSERGGGPRNPNSVGRELALLSKMFAVAIEKEYCEVNPVSKVDWPQQPNRRNRTLSDGEEELILSHMTGRYARLRAPFLTALYTGCRRGEMFQLTWDDINFERQYIYFREEITKTSEARISPLIEPAYSELLALKEQGVCKPTIFGISVDRAATLLRELRNKLMSEGLLKEGMSGFHIGRHSYATRAAKARIPPVYVKDSMGHKDFDMTFYYSHAGRDDLLEEAKKLEKVTQKPL